MSGKWTVRGCLLFCSVGLTLTARAFTGVAGPHLVGAEVGRQADEPAVSVIEPLPSNPDNPDIEMSLGEDRQLVAQLGNEAVSVGADLAARVAAGELTAEQSEEIAGDLSRLEGMAYRVPSVDVLKQDLGFPKESEIADGDLAELVRVHLQVVFGLGPLSAFYLSNHLGVGKNPEGSAAADERDHGQEL